MTELIQHFGIDWKLLLAQAVNFLILLVVLKKFAYGPIVKILQKRREEIEKGLKFTAEAKTKLEKIGEERKAVLKESRVEALNIINSAESSARVRKDEILKEAAKKSEALVLDAKRALGEEKAKMGDEVYKEAKELVRLAVAKVLGKLPSEEKDKILTEEALKELKSVYQK